MARATPELISALRLTIARLCGESSYQWGHMGMCNCGHVARSITGLTAGEIHQSAMMREGDWGQQARDYCPTSGLLIDHVIAAMLRVGLIREDIRHLEKLSDPEVLGRLPLGQRNLQRNRRQDLILYLQTWTELLEQQCYQFDSVLLSPVL